jgi:hypothetical protein
MDRTEVRIMAPALNLKLAGDDPGDQTATGHTYV